MTFNTLKKACRISFLFTYLYSANLFGQDVLFECGTQLYHDLSSVPSITVSNNENKYMVHSDFSPFIEVDINSNDKEFWGRKQDKPINGNRDAWQMSSFIHFINDDKWLISCEPGFSDSNRTRIYDVATKKIVRDLPYEEITHASRDGKTLLIINDNKIYSYNPENGNKQLLLSPTYVVNSVHYPTKADFWIITGRVNNSLFIYAYDKKSNTELFRISANELEEFCNNLNCDIAEDGTYMVSVINSSSSELKIVGYSLSQKKKIFSYKPDLSSPSDYSCSTPRLSNDGKYFSITQGEKLLYGGFDGNNIKSTGLDGLLPFSVMWLNDNKTIIVSSLYGVQEFDVESSKMRSDILMSVPRNSINFVDDKSMIVRTDYDITSYNFIDRTINWRKYLLSAVSNLPLDIHVASNKFVYSYGDEISVCSLNSGIESKVISTQIDNIAVVRFSESGDKILFSKDKSLDQLYIYDLKKDLLTTLELKVTRGVITNFRFDDVISNEITVVFKVSTLVFDVNGNTIHIPTNSLVSLPPWDEQRSNSSLGLKHSYGKVFTDDGTLFVGYHGGSSKEKSQILCLDLNSGNIPFTFQAENSSEFIYFTLCDKDRLIRAVSSDSNIYTWNAMNGSLVSKEKLSFPLGSNGAGAFVFISPLVSEIVGIIADTARVIICKTSPISSVGDLHTENNIVKYSITTYPNPLRFGEGNCTVQLPQTAIIYSVKSYNILGQVIDLPIINTYGNTCVIDTKSLSIGTYILTLHSQTNTMYSFSITVL